MKKRFWAMAAMTLAAMAASTAMAASVTLSSAAATFNQVDFNISAAIDKSFDNHIGWAIHDQEGRNQSAVFGAATAVGGADGTLFTFTLWQLYGGEHTIGNFKLSVTTDSSPTFTGSWNNLTGVTFAADPVETPANIFADGRILLKNSYPTSLNPLTSVYTVTGKTNLAKITGFKLDVLADSSLPFGGSGRQHTNGNFVLTEFQVNATAVPLPAAAWSGIVLLGALAATKGLKNLRRQTA